MKQNLKVLIVAVAVLISDLFLIGQLQAQNKAQSKPQAYYIAKNPVPSEYIRSFVTDSVKKWQQKGKFEPTDAYKKRVNEQTRQELVDRLTQIASSNFINNYKTTKLSSGTVQIKDYDADNQTWLVSTSLFGQIVLPVPLADAQKFEQSWYLDKKKTELYIDGETVKLKKMAFVSNGKTYWYDNSRQATFASTKVNITFDPIDIDVPSTSTNAGGQVIKETTVNVGKSDVDINIPVTNAKNDNTFVVIIANENYETEVSVPFALADGRLFKEYCIKTLGIPEKNIHFKENATLNHIRGEISWLERVLSAYKGDGKALVYYSGHGIPNEANGNAYILPVDGYGNDYKTGYALDELYTRLGAAQAESVTYFIDACFSGTKKDGGMVVAARGIAVKVKEGVLKGKSIVFSAAQGDQTAYAYNDKKHGMFTYFLLKKLQETKGDVSYLELKNYIVENVERTSIVANSKSQIPAVVTSYQIADTWKTWKLR